MPRDAVSRTAHVGTWLRKRNGGKKWVKLERIPGMWVSYILFASNVKHEKLQHIKITRNYHILKLPDITRFEITRNYHTLKLPEITSFWNYQKWAHFEITRNYYNFNSPEITTFETIRNYHIWKLPEMSTIEMTRNEQKWAHFVVSGIAIWRGIHTSRKQLCTATLR